METYKDHITMSPDMNAERLETLRQLFPDWFTQEGRLDINEVKKAVNPDDVDETERYEFRWFGKSKAKRNAFTPTRATLHYDAERSVNADKTENVIIEGENLEVLKILTAGYRNQVKCIYIDPPYNDDADTIYNDNFAIDKNKYWEDLNLIQDGIVMDTCTESSGRYHSDWMSNIYSRLLVARNLLKEDGVIFISINNKEIHHLRMVCDEVFGEKNFIECICWNKRIPKNDKGIGNIHEYILLYGRDTSIKQEFKVGKDGLSEIYEFVAKLKRQHVPLDEAEERLKNFYDKKGYDRGITLYCNLDENYELWGKINMSWPNANTFGDNYEVKHPISGIPVAVPDRGWRWSKDTLKDAANMDEEGNYKEVKRRYDGSYVCGRLWFDKDEHTQPSSILYLKDVETFLLRSVISTKSDGGVEVENIFGGKSYFSYPKSTSLIDLLVSSVTYDSGDIIMDFYAGSGTTGHVVHDKQINGENVKYILVQIPEKPKAKSIAEKEGYKKISDITIDRNKIVVNQYLKDSQLSLFSPTAGNVLEKIGFKVFTLSKSSFPRVDFAPNPEKSEEENLELFHKYLDAKEQQMTLAFNTDELITEILITRGFQLTYKLEKQESFTQNTVYLATDGIKTAYICVDSQLYDETINYFMEHTDTKFICIERALDTTKKFNLKKKMEDKFFAF